MKFKLALVIALLLTSPALVFAGATSCAAAAVVPADGRLVDFDFVAPSPDTGNFYQFSVSAGHSYSVEARQDYDPVNTDLSYSIFTDAGTCSAALTGVTDTTSSEPQLPANSKRVSFTAAANGVDVLVIKSSNASSGRYVSISVSDTTQYNVRWSTFGSFLTQWGFQNTTSNPISVTLTATPTLAAGSPASPKTISFVVPANTQVFKIIGQTSGDIVIGANQAGFAVVSNNGPAGGLLTDAFFIGSGNGVTIIVPSVFQPVRQGHSSR